jgi:DNA-binding MarR family transcriptional regulator
MMTPMSAAHATTQTEVPEFAGQLLFRLWRASHTQTAAALGSVGLTPPLFAVLNYLWANDHPIQQQVGAAMGIDPSTMVSLVDQLERAGLAERRLHARDRRAREVLITPKGRQTLERARELATEVEAAVLQGLAPAERDHLLTLLRRRWRPRLRSRPGAATRTEADALRRGGRSGMTGIPLSDDGFHASPHHAAPCRTARLRCYERRSAVVRPRDEWCRAALSSLRREQFGRPGWDAQRSGSVRPASAAEPRATARRASSDALRPCTLRQRRRALAAVGLAKSTPSL